MRDALGDYDEFEIPRDFELPVVVNQELNGIASNDGVLFAFFNVIREEVPRLLAKRKCEFLVKLANGEIMISKGKVYKRVSEQYQDGRIVVSFEALEAQETGLSASNGGIEKRPRGNPNWIKK